MSGEEIKIGFLVDRGHIFPSFDTFVAIYREASKTRPEWSKSDTIIPAIMKCDRDMINKGFESGFREQKVTIEEEQALTETVINIQDDLFKRFAIEDEEFRSHLVHAHGLAYQIGQRARILSWSEDL